MNKISSIGSPSSPAIHWKRQPATRDEVIKRWEEGGHDLLAPFERLILRCRFALHGNDLHTFEQLAEELSAHWSSIENIQRKALDVLNLYPSGRKAPLVPVPDVLPFVIANPVILRERIAIYPNAATEQQKKALLHFFREDSVKSSQEIVADELGISRSTVSQHLRRGFKYYHLIPNYERTTRTATVPEILPILSVTPQLASERATQYPDILTTRQKEVLTLMQATNNQERHTIPSAKRKLVITHGTLEKIYYQALRKLRLKLD